MTKNRSDCPRTTRPAAALAALALVAGCSFTPDLERPAAPVPEKFAGASDTAASAVPRWQEYFADPALRALIETALVHNRDMRIALSRVEEARALAGIARADRFPALEGQASASRSRTPADFSAAGEARIGSRYDLGLGITSFELDFWGRVAALNEAARARYLASEEAAKSFRISLIGDVAGAWFQLAELAERERLANETLRTREESRDLIRKRRDVGLATDLDALAAESLAESVRGQWAELRRQRMQTENALNLLTGMAAPLPPPAGVSSQFAMAELAPGLPSEVLLKRPDVRAAEQRLIAANANIGAARAAFFPTISLTGSAGTASASLDGLFDSGSRAWSFLPQITLPIFRGGALRANLDVAQVQKRIEIANYEKSIQAAFAEVADGLAGKRTLDEQIRSEQLLVAASQKAYQLAEQRFQEGVDDNLTLLDAQRTQYGAQQTLVRTRLTRLNNLIHLYKALGGGWTEHTVQSGATGQPSARSPG